MAEPQRRHLPDERQAITHKFKVAQHTVYLTVGLFDDGQPGELFLITSKEGSTISGLLSTVAILTSMALQYGVPLQALCAKFSHVNFEPSGWTSNPDIRRASSIVDYVFRWLELKFLKQAGLPTLVNVPGTLVAVDGDPKMYDVQPLTQVTDAPPCKDCGCIMVRSGACYKCMNCGETSGCS